MDAFKSYDLNKKHTKIKLTDLIQEVEFIRLEETAESLLGTVNDVHLVGDKFVFMGGGLKGDIFVFDNQGKLINKINRKGNGPGEYSWLVDLWVEGDVIAIFDRLKKTVFKYSLTGEFVSESELNIADQFVGDSKIALSASHVIGKENEYFLFMNHLQIGDQLNYNLLKLDSDMNITGMHLPFEGNEQGPMTSYTPFFDYKESVIYHRSSSDTVYLYNEGSFVPFIQFEFGDDWHWDDYPDRGSDIIKGLREGEKVWKVSPKVGPRYILTSSLYGKSGRLRLEHLIDRRNAEVRIIDLNRSSNKGIFDLQISHWESDDTFYAFLPSLAAVGLVTEATRKNWSFRGGTNLEEIASSENPVLVRIKIKDFSKN